MCILFQEQSPQLSCKSKQLQQMTNAANATVTDDKPDFDNKTPHKKFVSVLNHGNCWKTN